MDHTNFVRLFFFLHIKCKYFILVRVAVDLEPRQLDFITLIYIFHGMKCQM